MRKLSPIVLGSLVLAVGAGAWLLWPSTSNTPALPAPSAPNPDNPPVRSHVRAVGDIRAHEAKEIAIMRPADVPAAVDALLGEFNLALQSPENTDLLAVINRAKQNLQGLERGQFITRATQLLAEQHSARAAQLVSKLPAQDQQLWGNLIGKALAGKDPRSAAAWAATLDPGLPARALYETIGREWAGKDRTGALEWINSLNNDTQTILKSAAAEGVAWDWAQADLKELTTWASGISDEFIRNAVFVKAAKVLSLTDAPAAARWALTFPPGLAQRQAMVAAVTQWGSENLPAATQFAQQIPHAEVRADVLAELGKISAPGK